MAVKVTPAQVAAYRLGAHHLTERLAEDRLADAIGACGVQDSPPGSALLAAHARVLDISRERFEHAVTGDKSLLRTWSMRGAPFFIPTDDAAVFTTGVLPPTATARLHLISGVEPALKRLDMSLATAVELIEAEIRPVLYGRRLDIHELGAEVATRIADRLPTTQRESWQAPGPYAADQPWGEAVVHFCLRILTLRGIVCFAERAGNRAPFVLVDEWLGHSIPDLNSGEARAALLRRYLHCYGPSKPRDFAAWLGVRAGDVDPWWSLVTEELTQVDYRGASWIMSTDLDALRQAPRPRGLRLLPPRDPYTQMPDRETIIAKELHAKVWKTVGEPGAVLVDGEVAGIWRPRKSGTELRITVTAFGDMTAAHKKLLDDEAEQAGMLRGATRTRLVYG